MINIVLFLYFLLFHIYYIIGILLCKMDFYLYLLYKYRYKFFLKKKKLLPTTVRGSYNYSKLDS